MRFTPRLKFETYVDSYAWYKNTLAVVVGILTFEFKFGTVFNNTLLVSVSQVHYRGNSKSKA
jgi:hypothetical protein